MSNRHMHRGPCSKAWSGPGRRPGQTPLSGVGPTAGHPRYGSAERRIERQIRRNIQYRWILRQNTYLAAPQGTPEALPYPILRRMSSPSQSRAAPRYALLRPLGRARPGWGREAADGRVIVVAVSCPSTKPCSLSAGCHTANRLFRGFPQRGCTSSYALITADEKLRVLAGSLRTALVEETTHRMLGLYLL